jgi:hypothetical protein
MSLRIFKPPQNFNMSNLQEFNILRDAVEEVMEVALITPTRKREHVEARMVFSKILIDRGHTTVSVGKFLNKTHGSVIHYCRKFKDFAPYDKVLRRNYETVLSIYREGFDHIHHMDRSQMKAEIFGMRGKLKIKELEIESMKEKLKEAKQETVNDMRLERLKSLMSRVPVGDEEAVYNRLNIFLNGLHN